jgi:hypothetical protein
MMVTLGGPYEQQDHVQLFAVVLLQRSAFTFQNDAEGLMSRS